MHCAHAQSCPTLCDFMDCSPPGSSVHGIIQARILEWVTISFFILCALVMVITDCDCRSMHLHKHPGNPMQAHDICIGVGEGGTHPEQPLGENVSKSDESPG